MNMTYTFFGSFEFVHVYVDTFSDFIFNIT